MALDIAKRSVRGSLILFASNLAATVINAVTVFLIARLLGPTSYGVYSLALVIPGILQLFIGFGALPAVVRYAAYYTSIGKQDEAKRFTMNVMIFLFVTGAILTVISFLLAGSLSTLILQRPDLGPYVQLTSALVLGNTVLQTATASAIGWNWMTLSGFTSASQALIKLALSPLLIIMGFGITGALVGHLASFFLAGTIGVAILYLRRLRGFGSVRNFAADVKEMNVYGLPVYAGSVMAGLASSFVLVLLAHVANNTVYGYYQAAVNFTSPVTLLASAMISALFPAFASLDGIKGDVNQAFRHAYRFVAFLLTPLVMFMIVSAGPLIKIFYGAAYTSPNGGSVPYLQLLAFAYLPIAFGYSVHPAFFNGFGRTKLTFLLYLTASVTLFLAAPLLALTYNLGVDGLIYATFLSYFVAWTVGTFLAFRFMHAVLDIRSTGTILLVSVVAFLATSFLPHVGSTLATLVMNLVVFFGIYMTLAPLLRAVSRQDVDLLELTLSEPAIVGKIASPILRYERFLVDLVRTEGKQ
ncbi:MAG: oligosaccharide flippase family protein [Nitrososphaerales archaeon]|jgi:O-antigen/teichoic acid export membrane protein